MREETTTEIEGLRILEIGLGISAPLVFPNLCD